MKRHIDVDEIAAQMGRAFSAAEYASRRQALCANMARQGLSAVLVTGPEGIDFLTGLSHFGYFAYTALVLDRSGRCWLLIRAMERPTVESQVPDLHHVYYQDGESQAAATVRLLEVASLIPPLDDTDDGMWGDRVRRRQPSVRVGIEEWSWYMPLALWRGVEKSTPGIEWVDATSLVAAPQLVKSPAAVAYVREAAGITDAGLRAGIAAAGGRRVWRPDSWLRPLPRTERDVAVAALVELVKRGEPPGFYPFVRSGQPIAKGATVSAWRPDRVPQEHVTWSDRFFLPGDDVLIELSGTKRRLHAPASRFLRVGKPPAGLEELVALALEAYEALLAALRPGAPAGDAYRAWARVVNRVWKWYKRHHVGYTVGLGYPPSWAGSGTPVSLRPDSTMVLQPGMVFHVFSWIFEELLRWGCSDTVLITEDGCELLTTTPRELIVV